MVKTITKTLLQAVSFLPKYALSEWENVVSMAAAIALGDLKREASINQKYQFLK